MQVLQRISAEALRGGILFHLLSGPACGIIEQAVVSSRVGNVCTMCNGGVSGPVRYKPLSSKNVSKESRKDDGGKCEDLGIERSSDSDPSETSGGEDSRSGRRKAKRVHSVFRSARAQSVNNLDQGKSFSRGEAPFLNLTYADGRQVEASFQDGLGIFHSANNQETGQSAHDIEQDEPDRLESDALVETSADGKNGERMTAKKYALALLAAAPQPVANLRKKLAGRDISHAVIEETIKDLQRCGLQSDREYAETFARARWRSFSWGPPRIKQELRRRGLSPENIDVALKVVFESEESDHSNGGEGDDGMGLNNWGMTDEAKEHLLKQARRQWEKGAILTEDARKRRMLGWLARRGFKWAIIADVFKSLEGKTQ